MGTLNSEEYCNNVAKLLKPVISLRVDELKELKNTLGVIDQEKLAAAVAIHRTIVDETDNRYFDTKANKIAGSPNWEKLADSLHEVISSHQEVLSVPSPKAKSTMSLTVPTTKGAGTELPKMATGLLRVDATYTSSPKHEASEEARLKLTQAKAQVQEMREPKDPAADSTDKPSF